MKILYRLRFAMLGGAMGLSFGCCLNIFVHNASAFWDAVATCILISLATASEVHHEMEQYRAFKLAQKINAALPPVAIQPTKGKPLVH